MEEVKKETTAELEALESGEVRTDAPETAEEVKPEEVVEVPPTEEPKTEEVTG